MSAKADTSAELVSPIPGTRPINGSSPNRNFVPGTRMTSSMMNAIHLKSGSRSWRFRFSSGGRTSHSRIFDFGFSIFDCTDFNRPKSKFENDLTGNALQHLLVGREFLHEHKQTLDRFPGLVARETAPDQIDLFQFPWLEEQFFAPCAREENVHSRV